MPLIKGKSEKSFVKNMKTEMEHGKPQKQSLAIAYAMKRKAQRKKMADGGDTSVQDSMRKAFHFDDGGSVIGEGIKKSAKEAFKSPPSQMESEPIHKMASGVPATSDAGFSPEEAAKRQAIRKSYGYSKGGTVRANQGAYLDEHSIMDEIDREQPTLSGDGYYLKESPFKKEHIALNSSARAEDNKRLNQHPVDMHASTENAYDDLVDRIMDKRSQDFSGEARLAHGGSVPSPDAGPAYKDDEDAMANKEMYQKSFDFSDLDRYSEGGKVANQEHGPNNNDMAGFSPNEFDDLVLRDDLESTYGDDDNSGDSLDNDQENDDRDDIIARIMKSRAKKDRLPNPA
jgi:hypothetical protein